MANKYTKLYKRRGVGRAGVARSAAASYRKGARSAKISSLRRSRALSRRQPVSVNLGRGFPKKLTFTHNYTETIRLQSVGGSTPYYVFACNGMYDPNISGTGHQPYYFDQAAALYNHYVIIGSKIVWECVPESTTTNPMQVGVSVQDDAGLTIAAPTDLEEFPQGNCKLVAPSSMGGKCYFTQKWSAKKYFGGAPLSNPNLQGTPSANPTELSYYMIAMRPTPGLVTDCTLVCKATITYVAVWKEIKEIATS